MSRLIPADRAGGPIPVRLERRHEREARQALRCTFLTGWEREFLNSIRFETTLTRRQDNRLTAIYRKAMATQGGASWR